MHQKRAVKCDRAPATKPVLSDWLNKPQELRGSAHGISQVVFNLYTHIYIYLYIGINAGGIGGMCEGVMKELWRYSRTKFTPAALHAARSRSCARTRRTQPRLRHVHRQRRQSTTHRHAREQFLRTKTTRRAQPSNCLSFLCQRCIIRSARGGCEITVAKLLPSLAAPVHRIRTCERRFVWALCASRLSIRECCLARLANIISFCYPTTRWRWHRLQAASFIDVSQKPRLLWLFVRLQRGSANRVACRCAMLRTHRRVECVHLHRFICIDVFVTVADNAVAPKLRIFAFARKICANSHTTSAFNARVTPARLCPYGSSSQRCTWRPSSWRVGFASSGSF